MVPRAACVRMHVGIGERDIVTDRPQRLEFVTAGGVDHIHHVEAGCGGERCVPSGGENIAPLFQRDESGEVPGLAAHVGGALHVVLATQRIHAGAGFAEVAGE